MVGNLRGRLAEGYYCYVRITTSTTIRVNEEQEQERWKKKIDFIIVCLEIIGEDAAAIIAEHEKYNDIEQQ